MRPNQVSHDFFFSLKCTFHLCHRFRFIKKKPFNSKATMPRMNRNTINSFPNYGKRVTSKWSKLTSVIVSRLWFGMLVQNALGMYWDSFNCYVNCLHMWLLYVISLYLYVLVSKYVCCAWFCWPFLNDLATQESRMFCAVFCNLYTFWCFVISCQLLIVFSSNKFFIFVGNKFMQRQF